MDSNGDKPQELGQRRIKRGNRRDPVTIRGALGGAVGAYVRQFRKFDAMRALIEELPEELDGLVASFDVRLAPARDGGAPGVADQSTLYIYVASGTVRSALEKLKPQLLAAINGRSMYPVVEEFRYEEAGLPKIERQLNILLTAPD